MRPLWADPEPDQIHTHGGADAGSPVPVRDHALTSLNPIWAQVWVRVYSWTKTLP